MNNAEIKNCAKQWMQSQNWWPEFVAEFNGATSYPMGRAPEMTMEQFFEMTRPESWLPRFCYWAYTSAGVQCWCDRAERLIALVGRLQDEK